MLHAEIRAIGPHYHASSYARGGLGNAAIGPMWMGPADAGGCGAHAAPLRRSHMARKNKTASAKTPAPAPEAAPAA